MAKDLADLRYTSQEIEKKTKKIYCQILAESKIDQGNFTMIGTDDHAEMLADAQAQSKAVDSFHQVAKALSHRLSVRNTGLAWIAVQGFIYGQIVQDVDVVFSS